MSSINVSSSTDVVWLPWQTQGLTTTPVSSFSLWTVLMNFRRSIPFLERFVPCLLSLLILFYFSIVFATHKTVQDEFKSSRLRLCLSCNNLRVRAHYWSMWTLTRNLSSVCSIPYLLSATAPQTAVIVIFRLFWFRWLATPSTIWFASMIWKLMLRISHCHFRRL